MYLTPSSAPPPRHRPQHRGYRGHYCSVWAPPQGCLCTDPPQTPPCWPAVGIRSVLVMPYLCDANGSVACTTHIFNHALLFLPPLPKAPHGLLWLWKALLSFIPPTKALRLQQQTFINTILLKTYMHYPYVHINTFTVREEIYSPVSSCTHQQQPGCLCTHVPTSAWPWLSGQWAGWGRAWGWWGLARLQTAIGETH